MKNPFPTYRESYFPHDELKSKNIIVGPYSYYCGYYHQKPFEECVWYLDKFDEGADVDKLIIGKFCSIATGVVFLMGGNQGHRSDWLSTYTFDLLEDDFEWYYKNPPKAYEKKGDTIIGNDVWIGAEAVIMPGVVIGSGAIIGTRTVVTKDIEPYTVNVGVPNRKVRQRFSDDVVKKLLEISWWDWPIDLIKKAIPLLRNGDVDALISFKKAHSI